MPVISVCYSIRTAVQAQIQGLNLQLGSTVLPVLIRKLPKVDEDLDGGSLPCILLPSSDRPADRKLFAFGPVYRVSYPIEVVFVAIGNQDYLTNLDAYDAWHEQVTNLFKTPTTLKGSVTQVQSVRVLPGLKVDRSKVNANYDYGGLTLEVDTTE